MNPTEYRERARRCRTAAADSPEPVKSDFLWAAERWDLLADQLERLAQFTAMRNGEDPADDVSSTG